MTGTTFLGSIFFGLLAWLGAALAIQTQTPKRMAWGYSLCGISVGGIYLTIGFESLAFVQWFLTLIFSLAFSVYSYLFTDEVRDPSFKSLLKEQILPGALVLILGVIIVLGAHSALLTFNDFSRMEGVAAFGRRLIQQHLFAILILGVILFLCIVGVGVLGRPEVQLKEKS